jgi:hypothetical protein
MKKISITIVLLFIFNLVVKGLFLNHAPNSLSFQEVEILKLIHISPSIDDFSFRLINVFTSGLINVALFYLIYKKTKNLLLSLSVALAVCFAPWFFILSRYLNIYLIPLLGILFLLNILRKKDYSIFVVILLTAFRFLFVSHDLSGIKVFQIIPDLARLFDFRILFFEGDPASPMLRIPLTGFFYYIDLLAFFSGIYYLFLVNKNEELKDIVNKIFLFGLVLFLILPSDLLMTQRGELIFLWISTIIGLGYYSIISSIKKKSILLVFVLICIISANFFFTAELFINHFDKKNSSEWSYAERSTIKYLISKKDSPAYMTSQSDKLYRYLQFLNKDNIKAFEVPIDQMKNICQNPKNICIVKEEELSFFNIQKDDSQMKFGHYDGLPIYFILPVQ